jgi:murein DD-endopeptidase MepM/ murein hydrolase activator NlpD
MGQWVNGSMSDRDQWINELKQSLPESGEATLIVTKTAGATYLKLSRDQIDQFQQYQNYRQRLRRVAGTSAFFLAAGLIIAFLVQAGNLKSGLQSRDTYIAALTLPLEQLAEKLPEFAQRDSDFSATDMVARIDALKRLVDLQDESFRFYVESTRRLIGRDQDTLTQSLYQAGIHFESPDADPEDLAVGGTETLDGIADLTAFYLDDPLLNMLNERAALDDFVGDLPLVRPLQNARISSRFGIRRHPISGKREPHFGVDFVSYTHRDVLATADGIVTFADRDGAYGKKVVIEHPNQITTLYAHLDSIGVAVGDAVSRGDVLGVMGNTGRSTAAHLHYEVSLNGQHLDPLRLFGINNHVR